MCGICGVYDYGSVNPSVDQSLLRAMSDSIRHRGPDDEGTFISPDTRVGFGFRRLSIVDLSAAGHQPMQSPDGSVTIIFNGEIYNHLTLRRDLESKGYRYRSRSDTETIIYAYQEYGVEFVHRLLGMFAMALWDERKKRLVLVRDRIGVKPLYYANVDGTFIFASEIKAILRHPRVSAELNEEALEYYLTFMVPPAPNTLFKGIQKLEPGHRMIVTEESIRNERYWTVAFPQPQPSIDLDGTPVPSLPFLDPKFPATEESCVATIRTLLRQSIKDRMMSDVPFGVFLSGGIDSSTNVALMAELMDRPVETFSVGFKDLEKYNELGYARQIAGEFKTNHHEIIIDHKDAFDFLPNLIVHQDEPLADPVCIPLYFVSKLARENGTIVVQVGEGSDEEFAGYQWMSRELRFYRTVWNAYRSIPRFARRGAYAVARSLLEPRGSFLMLEYIRKASFDDELFWGGAVTFTESHKRRLLGKALAGNGAVAAAVRSWHNEVKDAMHNPEYLDRIIHLEFLNRLPELLLMRVDKMSMATSVEARVPFLDHRLVEYALRMPASLKIKNGESKYILKKAVEGIIPNNIVYRKKQGFGAPMNEWLRNEWRPFVSSQLLESSLVRQGYLRKDFVAAMLKRHIDGTANAGQHLWNLLNLVLWHRHWIEGQSLS